MNLRATSAEPNAPSRGAALKFAYPSGSRPLEGFTIKRGIGRGGFGEVYYASSDAGKEVALKLIRRNLDIELRGVTQCLNLKHPNLLDLYDIKQDELGDSWVVMEYVAGDCLEDVVDRHPNGLPRDEALAWFHGIAAGVAYLHDRGIVHRDLKPGNIFCDEGLVKIGDYGLSKFISASRRSGQTESVGTVHYMAPEIGNGRYGKEIDIYALGIILYELLTGRVPFDGESVGEVLMKHLTAEPDLTGLEEPFRAAIARTLTKDPEQRLRTVGELMTLLPAASKVPSTSAPTAFASAMPRPGANGAAGTSPPANPSRGVELAAAELVDEEPIWKAARDGWREFNQAWTSGRINTPAKVGLILVMVAVLFGLNLALVPIVAVAAIGYAGYFLVRSVMLANQRPVRTAANRPAAPRAPPAQPAQPAPRPAPPPDLGPPTSPFAGGRTPVIELRRRRHRHLAQTLPAMPALSTREHVQQLTGSLLLSTAVTAVMTVVLLILRGQTPRPEQFTWMFLVSTAGAWMVQIPSQAWAGTEGDAMLRRFVLMVCGLFLGAGAYLGHDYLLAELSYEWQLPDPVFHRTGYLYDVHGQPGWMAYAAYFGFLMLPVRWWQQANPLRGARLSLWATAVTVFWAWTLNVFWSFPQPWGIMVAATMSIAIQLASPSHNSSRRSMAQS